MAQGFPCIREIIISAENDNLHIPVCFPYLTDKLQSAHIRHLYVREKDINMIGRKNAERILSVCGL